MNYKVTIKKKFIKNLYLRIRSYDEVVVSAPFFATQKAIDTFIQKHTKWIERKLSKHPKKISYHFNQGDIFYYLGAPYTLVLSQGKQITIDDKHIYIPNDFTDKATALESWYKKQAFIVFSKIIHEYELILEKKVSIIRVKKMTTRWGSCNTKKAYINLNQELIKHPLSCIKYVVLHEMAHLTHPNHSTDFYTYIEKYMPNYKQHIKSLKMLS